MWMNVDFFPAASQMVYPTKDGAQKNIITVGDKWATFQSENFNAVSQPQYALISPDEKILTYTKGYTPKAPEFTQWLDCGLAAFRNKCDPDTEICSAFVGIICWYTSFGILYGIRSANEIGSHVKSYPVYFGNMDILAGKRY